MSYKAAMSGTKRAFHEMKDHEQHDMAVLVSKIADWRSTVRLANSELARMAKQLATTEERHKVERAVIAEEMRSELVDREANVARTAERFRVLQGRSGSTGNTYERAVNSVSAVEASIAQLCSHALNRNGGSVLLFERATCKTP
jgi:hypothetical protein